MVEVEYELDSTGELVNRKQNFTEQDILAFANDQTNEVNPATKNAEMARSSDEEETKDFVKNLPAEDLVTKMAALDINDDTEVQKKKKPRKKAKQTEKTENSISMRTRSRIADFVKNNPKPKKPKIGVVYDNVMTLHESHREEHPERPERVMAIYLNLLDKGIYDQLIKLESDEATEEELLLVHPKLHVNSVMNASKDLKTN